MPGGGCHLDSGEGRLPHKLGANEKENRNDWVVYTADGKVVGSGETIRVSATARDICKAVTAK